MRRIFVSIRDTFQTVVVCAAFALVFLMGMAASAEMCIRLFEGEKLKQIESTMSRALGFAVKIKTEAWDSFLDIYIVDVRGVRIAELMVLYDPALKSLSIDYIATRPYTHRGLGKNLLEAALVVYSETELLRAQSLISDNKAEFDKYLVGRTVPQAIRQTPMYKLFEKLGFTELIEDSISEQFAFSVKKPKRRIILLD